MGYWELVEAYFRSDNVVTQHLESYNQFVEERLPEIIEEHSVIDPEVGDLVIEIKDHKLELPMIGEKINQEEGSTPWRQE